VVEEDGNILDCEVSCSNETQEKAAPEVKWKRIV
jgi:hypothetical protein